MKKLKINSAQTYIAIIILVVAIFGIVARYFLHEEDESMLSYILKSAVFPILILNSLIIFYNIRNIKFEYSDEKIVWRFSNAEEERFLSLKNVECYTEQWYGYNFELKNGSKMKLSTDGLWKKDANKVKETVRTILKEKLK